MARKMERIKQLRMRVRHAIGRRLHAGETIVHAGYFAFVYIEGHGIYASVGGLLFIIVLTSLLVGDGE